MERIWAFIDSNDTALNSNHICEARFMRMHYELNRHL